MTRNLFSNCSLRFGIFLLFAIAAAPLQRAHAEEDVLTFCSFGPKVTVIRPKNSTPGKPCVGHVHVQALHWKCGSPEDVATTVGDFFSELNRQAKQECRDYCESLGDNCRAIFTASPICGLSTDRETAVRLGKELGCRNDCSDGKAFTYCSIYNTGYQGPSPDVVRTYKPNCECRPGT